jgi:hypothetical protein
MDQVVLTLLKYPCHKQLQLQVPVLLCTCLGSLFKHHSIQAQLISIYVAVGLDVNAINFACVNEPLRLIYTCDVGLAILLSHVISIAGFLFFLNWHRQRQ